MFNAMITRGVVAAAGLCFLAAPAAAEDAKAEWAAQAALLAYDNQADLQVREVGVEKRGGASVRDIAVTQSLNDWAFFANQPLSKAEYLRENADLELTDYLRQVKNASTLLQYGEKDEYVSRADTIPIMRVTADPKERRLYDSDHSMKLPNIAEERAAWLVEHLLGGRAPSAAGR